MTNPYRRNTVSPHVCACSIGCAKGTPLAQVIFSHSFSLDLCVQTWQRLFDNALKGRIETVHQATFPYIAPAVQRSP